MTQMPASGGGVSGGGGMNEEELSDFRMETEQQLNLFKQTNAREQQKLILNIKNQENKVDALESKVLDLWKRMPKVLAVLEPLQAQLEMFMAGPQDGIMDSTGGPGIPIQPMAPLMDGGTGGGPGSFAPAMAIPVGAAAPTPNA